MVIHILLKQSRFMGMFEASELGARTGWLSNRRWYYACKHSDQILWKSHENNSSQRPQMQRSIFVPVLSFWVRSRWLLK